MIAALMHSAIPSRRDRVDSVRRAPTSLMTAAGGQNAPTAFFAPDRSTATLPPIALSACASHVVGTWTSGTPRA